MCIDFVGAKGEKWSGQSTGNCGITDVQTLPVGQVQLVRASRGRCCLETGCSCSSRRDG